jgi:tetratricopeptide (TPR) repeat protein
LGKAQDDYRKALDCDPENYRAMEKLAGIYERTGKKTAEAIELYKRALELDPRPQWKELLGVSIAILQTRLNQNGTSSVTEWNKGNEELARGRLDQAQSHYSNAIQLNPEMYQAYFSRGLVRMRTQDLAGALADFEVGVRIDPRFPGGWVLKGLAHEQAGELDKARKDFASAARLDPGDPAGHYHLGRMCERDNDFQTALASYEEAVRLKPKPELLKLVLDRLSAVRARSRANEGKGPTRPREEPRLW